MTEQLGKPTPRPKFTVIVTHFATSKQDKYFCYNDNDAQGFAAKFRAEGHLVSVRAFRPSDAPDKTFAE